MDGSASSRSLHPTDTSPNANTYQFTAPAIVDSVRDVIRLSVHTQGIVDEVLVSVGDEVQRGQKLLSLEDADLKLKLDAKTIQKDIETAQLHLALENLNHQKRHHQLYQNINDARVVSPVERDVVFNKFNHAAIEVEVCQSKLNLAHTHLKMTEQELHEKTLAAPINAVVLQINAHKGEFIAPDYEQATILLGDADKAYVRVAIDARDVWQFQKNTPAYIKSLSEQNLTIPLTFARIEPYAVEKKFSLSQFANSADSQSVEIVYFFNRKAYPTVYPGQQFDAYIDTLPATLNHGSE